jgi:hypothetical protein
MGKAASAVTSVVGGVLGLDKPKYQAPPAPSAPPPMPVPPEPNNDLTKAAKERKLAQAQARAGRVSTMLTQDDGGESLASGPSSGTLGG